jgi:hypothetical protein
MKITTYSNWCDIDYLGDFELLEGDKLYINFPDGSTEKITVSIINRSYDVSDHGKPYTVQSSRAYWKTTVKGVKINIPLAGLDAVWVDIPTDRPKVHWNK